MNFQAQAKEPTVLLTMEQFTEVLGRSSAGNDQIAGAIRFVGGAISAAVTIYSAATLFQTVISNRRHNRTKSVENVQFSQLDSEEMTKLHFWLDTYFDKDELSGICYDLDVDYEDLADSGQSHKARELVGFCARHNLLGKLEKVIFVERPHLAGALSQPIG